MVPLHIILRDFPLVPLPLFGEEVRRVLLLQERIPFILLVGEDALDGTLVPGVLPRKSSVPSAGTGTAPRCGTHRTNTAG